jgi:hypothetical protein
MVGPLIYGFSEDAVAAAKVIADFAKGNDKLVIKGGAYAGKALDANGVKALASIPSREVLLAGRRPAEVADPAHGWRAGRRGRAKGWRRCRSRAAEAAAEGACRCLTITESHPNFERKSKWHSIKTHS